MSGIVAMLSREPVNQLLYDALLLLQHRGQDSTGMTTQQDRKFFTYKAKGMVLDAFRTRNMRALPGNCGLAHVCYSSDRGVSGEEEGQPFYVSAPYGVVLVHSGCLTNADALRTELANTDHRHTNTESDAEVLLNVLAHELASKSQGQKLTVPNVFQAVAALHRRVKGSYAVIAMIAGYGILAFRDPNGIRPLCMGKSEDGTHIVASESVALEGLGIPFERDIAPGEAVFIDLQGRVQSEQCAQQTVLSPCLFEYVYLARPDSTVDGISVYGARLRMGEILARRVVSTLSPHDIDTVIPIPESSRPSAMQLAYTLGKPYREGFVKNRYIGRTFIMPGQAIRKKSVRQKLNAVSSEFKGKNVLLVDDSIVRGTTSKEIIQMARDAGARKVYLASAAPPVRYPNFYGIDMPSQSDLIAHKRNTEEVRQLIGCDALIYQDLDALKTAIQKMNPAIARLEASCFDGEYITGDITGDEA